MDGFSINTDYQYVINNNQDLYKTSPLDTTQEKSIYDFSSNEAVFDNTKQHNKVFLNTSFNQKAITSKTYNNDNTSTFSVEYQDGRRYIIHYTGNKTEYSELYSDDSNIIIDNIGRVKTKTEIANNKIKTSEFKYFGDSIAVKEIFEQYDDGTTITYTDGLKVTQNNAGKVSVEKNSSTKSTEELNNSKSDNYDIEAEAKDIANRLHDIMRSTGSNRGAEILEILENEADPINIQLIKEEFKKITGLDLQEAANSVSWFINAHKINKLLDSLSTYRNPDSKVDNKYWQGDKHSFMRNGTILTIANLETNEMRQIDLAELTKNCKSSKERKQLIEQLQQLPGEVLMDIAAEQSSLIILNGETILDMENGAKCDAAGYYAGYLDQVAIYPNSSIGTIVHEFGHALDYNKLTGHNESSVCNDEHYLKIFNEEMEEYLADGNKRYVYGEYEDISKYATTNECEMFAECYALLMTGKCNSKDVIEKYFPKMLNYVKELIEYNRSQKSSVRH